MSGEKKYLKLYDAILKMAISKYPELLEWTMWSPCYDENAHSLMGERQIILYRPETATPQLIIDLLDGQKNLGFSVKFAISTPDKIPRAYARCCGAPMKISELVEYDVQRSKNKRYEVTKEQLENFYLAGIANFYLNQTDPKTDFNSLFHDSNEINFEELSNRLKGQPSEERTIAE